MATANTAQNERRVTILTIDTSSAQGGIALYDGQVVSVRSWYAGRSHTTTLLSEIHHLLEENGSIVGGLDAIGLAVGPGAFTGLRVGFGVAKGFHLATGVPLIGIPTLEAAALPFGSCGIPVVATVSAGRGRLVWARFEPVHDGLAETQAPRNGTAAELAAELRSRDSAATIVVGELTDDQAALCAEIRGVTIPSPAVRIRQPGAFAELTWRRWRRGRLDDASTLEPIYISR
jgi:tRNA threonylcarbamoyladenosine biosynthesis protein TsaB